MSLRSFLKLTVVIIGILVMSILFFLPREKALIEDLVVNLFATVFGGLILVSLFFVAREKIFPFPNISGQWYIEMLTVKTAYRPYNKMKLRYVAMLWKGGNHIQGTVEKIYEDSTTGTRQFTGKDRTRGELQGYVQKNYLAKDRAYLHVVEEGHGRESTHFYEIIVQSDKKMVGTFTSMVADQCGEVIWQREEF